MAEEKRKYTFKDTAYWEGRRAPKERISEVTPLLRERERVSVKVAANGEWEPASYAISNAANAYSSSASRGGSTSRGASAPAGANDGLNNLRSFKLPYLERDGRIYIRDAIQLCQRVYANIAIFRNTVDIMTEFSCAPIYLTGGNEASKKFISKWLEKAAMDKFQQFAFREYYLSGQVFILKFLAQFNEEDFRKLKTSLAAKKNSIPLRYTVLNPADIVIYPAASFENAPYRKALNQYELQQLRDRKTEEDRAVYNALPDDIKKLIDSGSWNSDGIYMPIPSDRLTPLFYKKQPYQPFAVPFGYPVLRDLNHKEELKKIDAAVARTIDNVILLVTMGEKKDEYGNGMNPTAMAKMQELFAVETVGRVIVSDYTTKATFVLPDIGEILNPEKYEIVNQDIKEGLLNIMSGEDKFANALIKTQIFIERLKEGRNIFLNDFLQKEIDAVCKLMGFKSIPKANFEEIDLKDQVQFTKIYTRLMEIGVLTPEQGLKAMQTGILPEPEELVPSQEAYHQERQKGMWNPLVGGMPQVTSAEGDATRVVQKELGEQKNAIQAQKTAGGPNPNSSSNGRPSGSGGGGKSSSNPSPAGTSSASLSEVAKTKHLVGLSKLKITLEKSSALMNKAEAAIKDQYKLEALSDTQKNLVYKLAANVMSTTEMGAWDTQLDAVLKEPEKHLVSHARNEISSRVEELAAEHGVDTYSASLLYHSKWAQP